jgi:hypothetical protein
MTIPDDVSGIIHRKISESPLTPQVDARQRSLYWLKVNPGKRLQDKHAHQNNHLSAQSTASNSKVVSESQESHAANVRL